MNPDSTSKDIIFSVDILRDFPRKFNFCIILRCCLSIHIVSRCMVNGEMPKYQALNPTNIVQATLVPTEKAHEVFAA
jgi:hypothetical protein